MDAGLAFGGGLSWLEAAMPVEVACVDDGVSFGGWSFCGGGLSWLEAAMPVGLACCSMCYCASIWVISSKLMSTVSPEASRHGGILK